MVLVLSVLRFTTTIKLNLNIQKNVLTHFVVDRINIPYKNETFVQTTIGQLNFLSGL